MELGCKMKHSSILILGCNGQLGTALRHKYPGAWAIDSNELDITDTDAVNNFDWSSIKVIINAAAYTNVDGAESPKGRVASWQVNAEAVGNLTRVARTYDITIVHISTDYVFDGEQSIHTEEEEFSPLSVYGSSKAAGDLLVSQIDKHYIIRTSWVIGEGNNFVRTMIDLGGKGINPTIVSDQIGRLTFTDEIVGAIDHLLTRECDFGTYNLTNSGDSVSWADVAREVYGLAGLKNTVSDISTVDYFQGKTCVAKRPLQSTLELDKIISTGYRPKDWRNSLNKYIKEEVR